MKITLEIVLESGQMSQKFKISFQFWTGNRFSCPAEKNLSLTYVLMLNNY